jgi:hypothetical protein
MPSKSVQSKNILLRANRASISVPFQFFLILVFFIRQIPVTFPADGLATSRKNTPLKYLGSRNATRIEGGRKRSGIDI